MRVGMALKERPVAGHSKAAPLFRPLDAGVAQIRGCSVAHRSVAHSRHRPAAVLSTYPLMERREPYSASSPSSSSVSGCGLGAAFGSQAWLAACVRDVVATLGWQGRKPMLQLVFSGPTKDGAADHRFQALPISQAVADNPQSWDILATHVGRTGASGLVLVRPIPSPEQFCAFGLGRPSTPQPDGFATSSADPRCGDASSSAPACDSGVCAPVAEGAELEGQVGDCCSSGGGPSRHITSSSQPGRPSGPPPRTGSASAASHRAGSTDYYGLVVQSCCSSDADGCWVLKVTGSGGSGAPGVCSCMHFTLTRVCRGQPLHMQLRDAWLSRSA